MADVSNSIHFQGRKGERVNFHWTLEEALIALLNRRKPLEHRSARSHFNRVSPIRCRDSSNIAAQHCLAVRFGTLMIGWFVPDASVARRPAEACTSEAASTRRVRLFVFMLELLNSGV
jgi:hypothetical protein